MNEEGRVCAPHVLDRVIDSDGQAVRSYQPRCDRRLPFDLADVEYVREALTGVVRPGGTAAGAFAGFPFEQVWLAGKTGTAEVDPKQDFSWFAAMVESQGERHVIVVLVEQGGHGSTTAAPIARHIIEGLYGFGVLSSSPTWRRRTDGPRRRPRPYRSSAAPIRHIDPVLLLAIIALAIVGLFAIYSATHQSLSAVRLDPARFVKRQITFLALGDHRGARGASFDYRFLQASTRA